MGYPRVEVLNVGRPGRPIERRVIAEENGECQGLLGRLLAQVAMERGVFFFSSRRRHTRYWRDWSSDVCSSDLMGLALLLLVLKTVYLRRGDETYNKAVQFWGKIFAVTFIMGVVTGIPMEFQFGTNWAAFSAFAGDIIAQTLAMEGAFAFFLESAFLGIFLFGERRFGQKVHWFSAFMLLLGTWASAYFILATNAWMQNPVGYEEVAGGGVRISDYWAVLLNPWVFVQFLHNQGGTVVTAAFVMTGLGAYYLLARRDEHYGRMFVRVGLVAGVIASGWMLFPTGHLFSEQVAEHQPVALAAMEGLFESERQAGVVLIGQRSEERRVGKECRSRW